MDTTFTREQKIIFLQWFNTSFQPHFYEWIFGPIDRLVYSQDALIGFIFMACTIDYLAGFWFGEDTKRKVRITYIGFIDAYFPENRYSSCDLFESLRNGLVHMFTIKDKKYSLTHNHPELHLKTDTNNQIILNAGDFRDDLYQATKNYFKEVEYKPELLVKFMRRYGEEGFLASGPFELQQ